MVKKSTLSQLQKPQWLVFQPILTSSAVQPPTLNEAFVDELKSTGIPFSHDAEDRVFRGHGKAFWEETLDISLIKSPTFNVCKPESAYNIFDDFEFSNSVFICDDHINIFAGFSSHSCISFRPLLTRGLCSARGESWSCSRYSGMAK